MANGGGGTLLLMEDIPMALDVSLPDIDESIFDLDAMTPPTTFAHKVPIPPRNRSNKILVDLAMLHNEAYDLQQQLDELKQSRQAIVAPSTSGKWAQVARNQLAWKLRSLRENDELKAMLKDQTAWRQQLEHLIMKKPRSIMNRMDDDEWRVLHLPVEVAARTAAMHAILDRQFDQVESEMVVTGLLDPSSDEVDSFRCNLASPQNLVAEAMRYTTMASPAISPSIVANSVWSTMMSLGTRPDASHLAYNWQMETIDNCTLYLRQWVGTLNGAFLLESGVVVKKYEVGPTTCVVWRSVLQDAKLPFASSSVVANHSGWIEIAPSADGQAVSFKAYCQVRVTDSSLASRLGPVLDAMRGGSGEDAASNDDTFATMQDAILCGFRVFEMDATPQDPVEATSPLVEQGVSAAPHQWTWEDMVMEAPTLSTPSYSIRCEA